MMRAPDKYSVVVRKNDGSLAKKVTPFISLTKRKKILGIPVVRGFVNLIETLNIGIKSLNWSVEQFASEEAEKGGGNWSIFLAFVLAMGIFLFLPLWVSNLVGFKSQPFLFNLFAGGIRVLFFLGYIIAIGRIKEIDNFFRYHGAEHKSVFTYEKEEELTVENARTNSPYHPRCGTSYILVAAVFAIIFFAFVDGLFMALTEQAPPLFLRLSIHFLLLPLMLGSSLEILKLSGKLYSKTIIARLLALPGLLLQRITAKEPTDDQLKVAIEAIKLVTEENDNAE